MEMWSLITASSTGHLRGTKSLAAAARRRTGSTPEPLSEFVTNAAMSCRTALKSLRHDKANAAPLNNETRFVFIFHCGDP